MASCLVGKNPVFPQTKGLGKYLNLLKGRTR